MSEALMNTGVKGGTLLAIEGLRTSFFTRHGVANAVDGIDLSIRRGEAVALVGESGCGKSMTAMSIMGLVAKPGRVTAGRILFGGDDLIKKSRRELRAITGDRISMIFQEPMTSLNPVKTVGNQVSEAIIIHKNISRAEAKARAVDIFSKVGIPEPERRFSAYPHQLSGGLRQRVMIGMAMVCEPELLIADEPTTALDVTIEAQILRLMRDLQREKNMSVLMITHNLGVVAEMCDTVYVMYAGQVVERAAVHELFKNPLHPYTRGLIKSLPRMQGVGERLYNIRGMVPNLLKMPSGCPFCPRCDLADNRCATEMPPLRNAGGHEVRCFMGKGGGE